jgi:hypothetical protein
MRRPIWLGRPRARRWRGGLGANLTRADIESLGFYVCVANLEEELVRSLGAAAVEQVIDAQGELGSFRTFQKQPAKRGQTHEVQLWRFMWNRKIRYATLLVDALGQPSSWPIAPVRVGGSGRWRCPSGFCANLPVRTLVSANQASRRTPVRRLKTRLDGHPPC